MNLGNINFKKNFSVSLTILLVFIFLIVNSSGVLMVWAFSGTGTGTEIDPYVITTLTQLQEMNNDLDAWYVLANDINASATKEWNGGLGFDPIGDGVEFTGHFDGQGYVIQNLYINRTGEWFVGLFGEVSGAEIKNVGVVCVDITGHKNVGGLVGYNLNSSITCCCSSGRVSGDIAVGGLVGYDIWGTTNQCVSSVSVNGGGSIGGFIGENFQSNFSRCFSSGNINGAGSVGGFIGQDENSSIIDCYSTGRVTGDISVGGFAGETGDSSIINCYSTGRVSGNTLVGGFIGDDWGGGATISCFWDIETSSRLTSAGGVGKTTVEMKKKSTYTSAGWDFITTWNINEDETYPQLVGVPCFKCACERVQPVLPVGGKIAPSNTLFMTVPYLILAAIAVLLGYDMKNNTKKFQ